MSGGSGASSYYTPYMCMRAGAHTRIRCLSMETAATYATIATAGGAYGN